MRLLDELVDAAKTDVSKRSRKHWSEEDYRTALDLRLTGIEAANIIGCSPAVVNKERREWSFEWK